ncbi:MAG TPA: 4Fe-4S dicluster domain-containing protein [Geobacteraceae bacterium]|nr:4Fe-4S dicluster domain-containing protein [Geobacteraceae bacterium]
MSYRLDPALARELAKFGGETAARCFNCGNCTAICALSEEDAAFPRKVIRDIQLGLEERLRESPEPWLCYYCGGCSETCPREAQPGELMMAVRRWLTAQYDWTGISRRLYVSEAWELGLLGTIALFVLALFLVPGMLGLPFGFQNVTGPALEHVRLDMFAPKIAVHYGDWVLALILALLLAMNAFRMVRFILAGEPELKVPLRIWVGKLSELPIHFVTQKRWLDCDNDTRMRWFQHLMLVCGYVTILLLVMVFLPWFQRDNAEFHFTALFGYYSTAALLGATMLAMRGRLRREEQIHKYSHATDWMFLILLFLTALTGIVLHLFRLLDLPWPTYIMYVVHLMVAVPMLVIEVPFGKWAHLAYRPLAKYLMAVREAARLEQTASVGATKETVQA